MICFQHIDIKYYNSFSFFYKNSQYVQRNDFISDFYHVKYEEYRTRTYLFVLVQYNKQPVCQWALLYLWIYKMQRHESLLYSLSPTSNISYRKATWIIFNIKRKGYTSSFQFCVPLMHDLCHSELLSSFEFCVLLLHDLCHSELFLNRVKLAPSSCSRLNRQTHS